MSGQGPSFDQVNLVVTDMDAAIAFYRALGLDDVPDAQEWPAGTGARHTEVAMSNGMRLELDNVEMAKLWHHGLRDDPGAGRTVLGFALPSREAVDQRYADVTGAGHAGPQPPYDAFWGGRYAIVEDPDGNQVGLMSPIDPSRRYLPEA